MFKLDVLDNPQATEVQQKNIVVLTLPDGSDMPIATFTTYEEAREYLHKCWLGTVQIFKEVL